MEREEKDCAVGAVEWKNKKEQDQEKLKDYKQCSIIAIFENTKVELAFDDSNAATIPGKFLTAITTRPPVQPQLHENTRVPSTASGITTQETNS